MYRRDFGRIVTRTPRTVVHATREDQVVDALRAARRSGMPLTVRGAGHSCNGQALTDGVLLVNDSAAAPAPRLQDDGLVTVSGRSHWRAVERFLNARGRSVAVLADYLDLSVGGTLSVGGYGGDSVVHGAQVDQVERLRLIRPDGTAIWCSAQEHSELFGFALGGLGQVGVIESAVLRTIPHRPLMTLFTYRHAGLRDLIESIGSLASSDAAFFKGLQSRGRTVSTYGVYSSTWGKAMTAAPPLRDRDVSRRWVTPKYRQLRSLAVALWVARFGRSRRMWSDYLFDYAGLVAFEAFLHRLVERDAFAGCLKSVYIVAIRKMPRPVPFPLEASDATRGPMTFGIGLYSMIPGGRADLLERVDEAAARCLETCVELGGRPYLYGWHRVDLSTRHTLYGAAYERLADLREAPLDVGGGRQGQKILDRRAAAV